MSRARPELSEIYSDLLDCSDQVEHIELIEILNETIEALIEADARSESKQKFRRRFTPSEQKLALEMTNKDSPNSIFRTDAASSDRSSAVSSKAPVMPIGGIQKKMSGGGGNG